MKGLIVYDSAYGNTGQIAQAVGNNTGSHIDVNVLNVREFRPDQITGIDLLIIGSPTQRFQATPAISNMLKEIRQNSLKGVMVTAFDTRFTIREIKKTPVLSFFVRLSGDSAYAATHIVKQLTKNGGQLVVPPEGFYVEGTEGPLVQGELDRAADWAKNISRKI